MPEMSFTFTELLDRAVTSFDEASDIVRAISERANFPWDNGVSEQNHRAYDLLVEARLLIGLIYIPSEYLSINQSKKAMEVYDKTNKLIEHVYLSLLKSDC